jgi:uncharacterized protein YndB with AHSA1/START domain
MGDGGEAVRLERTFRADNERVFRAFTEPAEVVLWWTDECPNVGCRD